MDGSATFAMASGRLATAEATINVARMSPALGGAVDGISAGTTAVFVFMFILPLYSGQNGYFGAIFGAPRQLYGYRRLLSHGYALFDFAIFPPELSVIDLPSNDSRVCTLFRRRLHRQILYGKNRVTQVIQLHQQAHQVRLIFECSCQRGGGRPCSNQEIL